MSRPGSDADKRMIEAGSALLREGGLDAVDVRAVCARAEANPGLFHYYFKSKRSFLEQVLAQAFGGFFAELERAAAGQAGPRAKLEAVLVALGRLAVDQRALLASLNRLPAGKGKASLASLPAQTARLSDLIGSLLLACQGKAAAKELQHLDLERMLLVESAVSAPLFWGALDRILGPGGRGHLPAQRLAQDAFSEKAIRHRVRLALASLLD